MTQDKPTINERLNEAYDMAAQYYKTGGEFAPKVRIPVFNFILIIVVFAVFGLLLVVSGLAIEGFVIIVVVGSLITLLIVKLQQKQKREAK